MKLKANKKIIGLSLSLVIASIFLLISPARADWGLDLLQGICSAIVSSLGWILIKIMGLLVYFAQYNGFIQSQVVINGWVIVRDVCNMFFVLVLLIIAFATILRIEEYNYKKWLPKLILMAILINFSKTICGLLIDAAQIVMLTFVNSFKDVAGANLTTALGITNWESIQKNGNITDYEVAAALVLSVIYVIISIIVISAMLAMIAMRIVMLWIYIVLSPIAYLMSAFPAGKKYASQWWSQFTQNLIVGPVLAFFIWLSFTSLTTFSNNTFAPGVADPDFKSGATSINSGQASSTAPFGTSDVMIKFIVAIGLLLGGMKITQEIGGVAGSAASAGMSRINKMGKATVRGVGGAVGAVSGYNFAKRRYGDWQKKTKEKIQAKSDLVYETAKGGVRGTFKGAKNVVVGGFSKNPKTEKQKEEEKARYDAFKDGTYRKNGKEYNYNSVNGKYEDRKGNTATGLDGKDVTKMSDKEVKNFEKTEQRTSKKEEKKNKKEEDKRIYEAYTNKVYKDEKGEEFEYDEETNRYVNKNGDTAKRKGKKEGEDGYEIEKMSDTTARFKAGMSNGMTNANALRNVNQEKKQDEQQKILEASGASTTELKRIMNDSSVNKNRRLAAAMTLAIKNGFKNNNHTTGRQDVNNAKALIGNNEVVLKKFNEAVNKTCAHLNHNLDNDAGKATFKRGMDEGKIDGYGLDSSAYTSKELMKTLSSYSGVDFADNISRLSSKSSMYRNNVNGAFLSAKNEDVNDGKPLYDSATDELNKWAKLIARTSGDMKNAFGDKDGNLDEEATQKFFSIAKPSWLGNFDTDQLKKNGTNDNLVDSISRSMAKGIEVSNIVSLERSGSNPDLVKRLIGAVNALDKTIEENRKKQDEIKASNILGVIKPIPR